MTSVLHKSFCFFPYALFETHAFSGAHGCMRSTHNEVETQARQNRVQLQDHREDRNRNMIFELTSNMVSFPVPVGLYDCNDNAATTAAKKARLHVLCGKNVET